MLPLADRAVVAIFSFVEYPKTYAWDTNWDQSHDIDQGARRYAHNKQKFAVGGKLHDRPQKDAPKQ